MTDIEREARRQRCGDGEHEPDSDRPVVNAVEIGTTGTLRHGDVCVRICKHCRNLYMRRNAPAV